MTATWRRSDGSAASTGPPPRRTDMAMDRHRGIGHPGLPPQDSLADVLERVLDKGIVIAGDIQINLLDIELLTIKLRLLIASVDKAKEMGIDWWESDPMLSSKAAPELGVGDGDELERGDALRALERENRQLRERLDRLEGLLEAGGR